MQRLTDSLIALFVLIAADKHGADAAAAVAGDLMDEVAGAGAGKWTPK